jgi:hypothetical protein
MNFNTVAKNTNTNAGATAAFVINQAASAATMEAAASLTEFVPPGLQQRHPSAAKFWAKLNGATGAILASYNVTSATRVSTGNYIVSYVTNFSSVNYGGNVTPLDSGTPLIGQWLSQAAGNCQIQVLNLSGLVTDPTAVTVTGFGDQ